MCTLEGLEQSVAEYVENTLIGRDCHIQRRLQCMKRLQNINADFAAKEIEDQTEDALHQRDLERMEKAAENLRFENVPHPESCPLTLGMDYALCLHFDL